MNLLGSAGRLPRHLCLNSVLAKGTVDLVWLVAEELERCDGRAAVVALRGERSGGGESL